MEESVGESGGESGCSRESGGERVEERVGVADSRRETVAVAERVGERGWRRDSGCSRKAYSGWLELPSRRPAGSTSP